MTITCAQPTPYSILHDPDDPRDVFEEIIPDTDAFYEEKRKALWNRYHDTGIGNANLDYWIRCMRYRAQEIEERYDVKFRAWSEFKARLGTAQSLDLSDGRTETGTVSRVFDPPETASAGTAAEQFLAEQDKVDYTSKTFSGLEPDIVRDYMDGVTDPYEDYAREYDRLMYWGL